MMKRILIALTLTFTSTLALAHGYGPYHPWPRPYHYHCYDWVVPAIIGGAVVYGATHRPLPPPPVLVQTPQPPTVVQVPVAPTGYHYETLLDAACNCYRTVLVPN